MQPGLKGSCFSVETHCDVNSRRASYRIALKIYLQKVCAYITCMHSLLTSFPRQERRPSHREHPSQLPPSCRHSEKVQNRVSPLPRFCEVFPNLPQQSVSTSLHSPMQYVATVQENITSVLHAECRNFYANKAASLPNTFSQPSLWVNFTLWYKVKGKRWRQ